MPIIFPPPTNGFFRPSPSELERLRSITSGAFPWFFPADQEPGEFKRALMALGYFHRLPTPSKKRPFYKLLADINDLLDGFGADPVGGNAFLAGVMAHTDIPYTQFAPHEIGLDRWAGLRCTNAHLGLINGTGHFRPPTPPREVGRSQEPQVKLRRLG